MSRPVNLELLIVAFVAQCIKAGFDSASVAAALVRAAAHLASGHHMSREDFIKVAGVCFDAVAKKRASLQ